MLQSVVMIADDFGSVFRGVSIATRVCNLFRGRHTIFSSCPDFRQLPVEPACKLQTSKEMFQTFVTQVTFSA